MLVEDDITIPSVTLHILHVLLAGPVAGVAAGVVAAVLLGVVLLVAGEGGGVAAEGRGGLGG